MSTAFTIGAVALDTDDVARLSRFYADLLGGTVEDSDPQWHEMRWAGGPTLGIQHAPGHRRPSWPDGLPQQVHLDFDVPDIAAAHAHAMGAGAQLLSGNPQSGARAGFVVYADPAGHPFCLCWG